MDSPVVELDSEPSGLVDGHLWGGAMGATCRGLGSRALS